MASENSDVLRIAVIGVDLAGGAVGAFLQSVPGVDVRLFERSTVHRHVGAWIGVTAAGQLLLEEICGEDAVDSICSRTYSEPEIRDWKSGTALKPKSLLSEGATRDEMIKMRHSAGTTRQDLLKIILEHVPSESIHLGKKGTGFTINDNYVTAHFHDGTNFDADLLIVADGINSKIRNQVYPDSIVKHMPSLEYMEVFDRKELSAKVDGLPSGTTCFFRGETMVFMGDIGCGRFGLICVVPNDPKVTSKLGWADGTDPKRLELLKQHFKEWNPMVRNVLNLSKDMGVYPIARGGWLSSLTAYDRICFIGDAAHPTGGAFGAGCSSAFEDAKTLTLALKHVHHETGQWSAGALKRALELYDNTRSPHIFKVFEVLESADGPEEQSAHEKMEVVKQMKWLTNIDIEDEFHRTLSQKTHRSYQREGLLLANRITSMFAPRGSVTTA